MRSILYSVCSFCSVCSVCRSSHCRETRNLHFLKPSLAATIAALGRRGVPFRGSFRRFKALSPDLYADTSNAANGGDMLPAAVSVANEADSSSSSVSFFSKPYPPVPFMNPLPLSDGEPQLPPLSVGAVVPAIACCLREELAVTWSSIVKNDRRIVSARKVVEITHSVLELACIEVCGDMKAHVYE